MTAVSGGLREPRDSPAAVPPGERGATRIADRVVAKIAARAAREAAGPLPPDAARPYASVAVHQDTARVRVHVELGYPADIGARCGRVRHRIVQRVRTLAGMAVPEVVVHVERLHPPAEYGATGRRTR
ncbi:Asp23/Gls24 family envelope stress response protein [Streptomyces sp. NPDC052077]|uniref:Asp23/Gls24 family envelope stress response protein n=1 Tax=Streptomyces sp. NPDC052077 TaxID=3154757 RepID=UPI003429764C